jgi:hypothetical protein
VVSIIDVSWLLLRRRAQTEGRTRISVLAQPNNPVAALLLVLHVSCPRHAGKILTSGYAAETHQYFESASANRIQSTLHHLRSIAGVRESSMSTTIVLCSGSAYGNMLPQHLRLIMYARLCVQSRRGSPASRALVDDPRLRYDKCHNVMPQ